MQRDTHSVRFIGGRRRPVQEQLRGRMNHDVSVRCSMHAHDAAHLVPVALSLVDEPC